MPPLLSPPPSNYKNLCRLSHPAQHSWFRTVKNWDAPPLTVVTPQEQMELGLRGVEEAAAEPGPHLLPRAPCSSIPQPYPPGRRLEGTQTPGLWGCWGGGPEGVVSWWAVRPWRSHTACTSSGHVCVPTRCGWGPRTLQAGRPWSVPGSTPEDLSTGMVDVGQGKLDFSLRSSPSAFRVQGVEFFLLGLIANH